MPRTPRPPVPFAFAATIRGRPKEIAALVDELSESLSSVGFRRAPRKTSRVPLRFDTWETDNESLVVVVAPPQPYQLRIPNSYELTISGTVRNSERLHELAASLPFTRLELEDLSRDMPLTASAASRMTAWLGDPDLPAMPMAGYGAIFTIHHQTDFVLLIEQALSMGIDQRLVTVIDKEYRYAHSRRVDAHLQRRLGIPVFCYAEMEKAMSEHIRRVDQLKRDVGSSTWAQTIIVDDGGYVYPLLHEKFEPFLTLFKGLVEQTASGIWNLEPFAADVRVPVFSVAESRLKQVIEAHGVAAAGVANVRRLLPHEKFDGRPAVVVGYGRVGRAAADALRRANADVWVVDSSAGARADARERGFRVSSDLADTVRRAAPRYLFACARPGAVARDALLAIPCDCALVSLTSRDAAFDKPTLEAKFRAEPLGTLGTRYHREGVELLLIADGFPANFHYAESMPNQQSDIVMSALLVGAAALAQQTWADGNDTDRADVILSEGTLMADFETVRPPLGPSA